MSTLSDQSISRCEEARLRQVGRKASVHFARRTLLMIRGRDGNRDAMSFMEVA